MRRALSPEEAASRMSDAELRTALANDPWILRPVTQFANRELASRAGNPVLPISSEPTVMPRANCPGAPHYPGMVTPEQPIRRRRVATRDPPKTEAPVEAPRAIVAGVDYQRAELRPGFASITEKVFTLDSPETLWDELLAALEVREALTPLVLTDAVNKGERHALEAHQLFVVAKAECERVEAECAPIVASMRDAANRELQAEKEKGLRNKSITDADVVGKAAAMFPDEWARVVGMQSKAEGMLAQLKQLAKLWEQRCFSLSTMLNAGRQR